MSAHLTSGIILNVEQGSPEWFAARCGIVTASRLSDVAGTKKVKGQTVENAARAQYRMEIMCEILTGQPYPQYVSKEMQWGLDQEPFARAAYEMQRDVLVERVGFVLHPQIPRFGCSPDGFVGERGLLQIKCPNTNTHLNWLLDGVVPMEHYPQMIAELSCNPDRDWCDFVSFDPRLPEHLQLFVRRFERHDDLITAVNTEVLHFNDEVDEEIRRLPKKPSRVADVLEWPNADEVEF